MELCFATNNKNKLKEISLILGERFIVKSLQEIGCHEELPENQDTLEGNSMEKAQHVYNNYNINCFADDTGLEVDALNGAPGVYSARYAGPTCNSEDNMSLLLEEMKGVKNRKAKFKTVITVIIDGQAHQLFGEVNGHILLEKRGNEGFGYDPVFVPENYNKTFAELSLEEKNKISHRSIATNALIQFLKAVE